MVLINWWISSCHREHIKQTDLFKQSNQIDILINTWFSTVFKWSWQCAATSDQIHRWPKKRNKLLPTNLEENNLMNKSYYTPVLNHVTSILIGSPVSVIFVFNRIVHSFKQNKKSWKCKLFLHGWIKRNKSCFYGIHWCMNLPTYSQTLHWSSLGFIFLWRNMKTMGQLDKNVEPGNEAVYRQTPTLLPTDLYQNTNDKFLYSYRKDIYLNEISFSILLMSYADFKILISNNIQTINFVLV